MINYEKRNKIIACGLVVLIGSAALIDRKPAYEGWIGCDQAEIRPGPANIRLNINKRLLELNNGNKELVYGSAHFVKNTETDAKAAINSIYDTVYDRDYVELQAGDKIPFCVSKEDEGSKTADKRFYDKGIIEVQANDYKFTDNSWQVVTGAAN